MVSNDVLMPSLFAIPFVLFVAMAVSIWKSPYRRRDSLRLLFAVAVVSAVIGTLYGFQKTAGIKKIFCPVTERIIADEFSVTSERQIKYRRSNGYWTALDVAYVFRTQSGTYSGYDVVQKDRFDFNPSFQEKQSCMESMLSDYEKAKNAMTGSALRSAAEKFLENEHACDLERVYVRYCPSDPSVNELEDEYGSLLN